MGNSPLSKLEKTERELQFQISSKRALVRMCQAKEIQLKKSGHLAEMNFERQRRRMLIREIRDLFLFLQKIRKYKASHDASNVVDMISGIMPPVTEKHKYQQILDAEKQINVQEDLVATTFSEEELSSDDDGGEFEEAGFADVKASGGFQGGVRQMERRLKILKS